MQGIVAVKRRSVRGATREQDSGSGAKTPARDFLAPPPLSVACVGVQTAPEKYVPKNQLAWAAALALLIVLASSGPVVDVPGAPDHFDKVAHFGAYGLLATLFGRVTAVQRWTSLGIWIAVPVVSLFGVTDEVHQHFTPGRTMEFLDWVADTLGAIVAIALYAHWPRYRRSLETPIVKRRQRQVENASPVATVAS
jgi:VanZ family protein